jgi:hypothetical protein
LTSVFFVTAPTYVPVSLPPSLPPHMLSFHFVKDKMQVEKEIDYATEVTALEGKSTYEMLRDARVAELVKRLKPVEDASNDF